jgi:hypothetical protein
MALSETKLLAQLLKCWNDDIYYLIDFCEKNDFELDIEDIQANFWEINVNTLIYSWIYTLAEKFIQENEMHIKEILNVFHLDEYRNYNDLYEIYTNFTDSYLWFKDERIQNLFNQSRYEV